MTDNDDIAYMRKALALARKGLGQVWPNPSVGCALVKGNDIIAQARTGNGGRPHAETIALDKAGTQAKGATAYVTLEPCRHEGETPSCAEALIKAGVKKVVVACTDPDPRTSGHSIAHMISSGIEVIAGVCEEEAAALNRGFFLRTLENRPLVSLKCATSLDGKMAMQNGESKWITGETARAHVHRLRAGYDAVLTGIGTVLHDDPQLTVRIKGHHNSPLRIVLDPESKLPPSAAILPKQKEDPPTWVISRHSNPGLTDLKGVRHFEFDTYDIGGVLGLLAEQGLTRLLVEAGPRVLGAFISSGYWDDLYWYRAPRLLGPLTRGVSDAVNIDSLEKAIRLKPVKTQRLGEDLLEIYQNPG